MLLSFEAEDLSVEPSVAAAAALRSLSSASWKAEWPVGFGGVRDVPDAAGRFSFCLLSVWKVAQWSLLVFSTMDIECQACEAIGKCIYLATCQPRWVGGVGSGGVVVVVANVTVKGN